VRRRSLLRCVASGGMVLLAPGVEGYETADDPDAGHEGADVTVDNVGVTAWEVTSAEEEVAETGVENPELTLTVGKRYSFENRGWLSHPFEFRDADGNVLLSQATTGEFEGDDGVDWNEGDSVFSFTVTEGLAERLESYVCTIHRPMNGSVKTVAEGGGDERGVEPSISFGDQGVGTVEGGDPAVFGTVSAGEGDWVAVTHEKDGGRVVSGVGQLGRSVDNAVVGITVETDGVPGEHTMHVLSGLSDGYAPGDELSEETAGSVLAQDSGVVFDVEVVFEDQSFEGSTDEVAVKKVSLFDGSDDETLFTVNLYPTDEEGEIGGIGGGGLLGSSEVVGGENEGLTVDLQTPGGEAVEIEETEDYFAVVHLVEGEDAQEGDTFPPGTFDALERLSEGERSRVRDGATVTIEEVEEEDDRTEGDESEEGTGDNATGDEGEDEDREEESGEGMPGFGVAASIVAGVAGGALHLLRSSGDV